MRRTSTLFGTFPRAGCIDRDQSGPAHQIFISAILTSNPSRKTNNFDLFPFTLFASFPPDQDISRMRIAVDPSPLEDHVAVQLQHRVHGLFD